MNTKQFLKSHIDSLDQAILHPRYKSLCRDYVAGTPLSELCQKYAIKKSRVHFMLRYSVLALKDLPIEI